MKHVSASDIRLLRQMRHDGFSMALMCARFPSHGRDAVVEMIDASYREQNDLEASKLANRVLTHQAAGWPMVNGRPSRHLPAPMF